MTEHCICCFTAADAEIIARGTVGFSGAELENLVNQAALKAAVDGKEMVTMKELEFAKDKILMGERTLFVFQICSMLLDSILGKTEKRRYFSSLQFSLKSLILNLFGLF